jgi:hypothetical protein
MKGGSCRVYLGLGFAACLAVSPGAGWAANARNPYGNVNHANDAGNDTGDSQVEALNQAQLSGPGYTPPPAYAVPRYPAPVYAAPVYPPPIYAPRPYYYPGPVYVAPSPGPYYRW